MKKLYNFEDKNIDRQFWEVVNRAFADLPVYANNAAAVAGGLKVNQPYKTAAGAVMVVV